MDNPDLYITTNCITRDDSAEVLYEFWPRLSWSEVNERVLDIGFGPGDVTAEILLPRLPAHAHVTGVDISPNMVEYASKRFGSDRIDFKYADISVPNITDVLGKNKFTKVFSFYALQLVKDQKQLANNISELLCEDGEFVIITVSPNGLEHKVFKELRQMDKWKFLFTDYEDTFFFSENPCEDLNQIWSDAGLEIYKCEERTKMITFQNMSSYLALYESVNVFIGEMDQDTKEQHMKDYRRVVEDNKLLNETSSGEVLFPNITIVMHGRRRV